VTIPPISGPYLFSSARRRIGDDLDLPYVDGMRPDPRSLYGGDIGAPPFAQGIGVGRAGRSAM